jgi:hypothetical protein
MKQPMTRRKLLKVAAAATVVPYLAFGRNLAFAQTAQLDPQGARIYP